MKSSAGVYSHWTNSQQGVDIFQHVTNETSSCGIHNNEIIDSFSDYPLNT